MVNPMHMLLGGILPGLFGSSSSSTPAAAPAAPTPVTPPTPTEAAPPASNPVGSNKSAAKVPQQSFIGAAATPNTQSGQKTLLGQ